LTYEQLRAHAPPWSRAESGAVGIGTIIEAAPSSQNPWPRIVVGAVLPLAVVGIAYLLWWISDRLVYVGPLDRAAFGWVVVVPVWIAAPAAAGLAWRRLEQRTTLAVSVLVGAVIAAVAAALLWQAIAFPACDAIHAPQDLVAPSLLFGAVVGGGLAMSGLVSTRFARQGRLIAALVLGAGTELLMVAAAILVISATLLGPSCQRSV
jgi:hypothetical protein